MIDAVHSKETLESPLTTQEILQDYRLTYRSRQVSYIGRREVMSGKAKFGIFGDGKELPQVAMAHFFQPGDWRSGYYRDQTFAFATGLMTIQQFFAQLYAHTDLQADPATAGRSMNAHFASRSLDEAGEWKDLTAQPNSAADISPTGSQMPRTVGLAYASKLYRQLDELRGFSQFSKNGDEVVFATIGNASSAEGLFWESINAIGVLRCPAIVTIYDDGYGISVSNEHQIAKENISELLSGFRRPPGECCDGFDIYVVKGWDYLALVEAYQAAAKTARTEQMPAIVHVTELTQPQGHSTSGSHERYKSQERLAWEGENDCLLKFRQWMLAEGIVSQAELEQYEEEDRRTVEEIRKQAWQEFASPIEADRREAAGLIEAMERTSANPAELAAIKTRLLGLLAPMRRDINSAIRQALTADRELSNPARRAVLDWQKRLEVASYDRFSSHLYCQGKGSVFNVKGVAPTYSENSPTIYGFEVLNACFEAALAREPRLIAFGEDVGRLGDVNQGFRGLQDKFGPLRVADTGIREATIVGQAIGMAMRGLRPLAEIQYLDYLLYALQIISDDLATLHWRTKGGQKAPVIIRTRGHRLEGIWHAGSPMAGIIHLVRGIHVLTPRDMTRAAGFYNALLQAEEPALVVEALNGYRLKERMPDNIASLVIVPGTPEVLRTGTDISLVTYGACCRIVLEAAEALQQVGISATVIDVQSLLPFDRPGMILESLKKTSRIAFIDEDVPGGTTAYMLQEVLEKQGGFQYLDSAPLTISGKPHRPAYGSDGDYWSKPNVEQIVAAVYDLMTEANPTRYPPVFK